jgi:hypothetical protein
MVTAAPSLWETVADFTLGLLLTAARNIPQAHRQIQLGNWSDQLGLKVCTSPPACSLLLRFCANSRKLHCQTGWSRCSDLWGSESGAGWAPPRGWVEAQAATQPMVTEIDCGLVLVHAAAQEQPIHLSERSTTRGRWS